MGKLTLQELEACRATLPFVPFPWQWEDVLDAQPYDRYALFVPVGGGKTSMATLIAMGWGDPHVLVLLPPILINSWVKWLNSLEGSGGALAFRGSPEKRHALPIENYKWLIMSTDIFKRDFELLYDYFFGLEVTIIYDEAHGLKNASSGNFKKVQKFASGRKLLLATGTELNSPGDAYGYIKLKNPDIYRSKAHFDNLHVSELDFFNKPTKWTGHDVITENLYKQATKRTKEQIHAHLPKANYIPIEYDLEPAHLKLYTKLADEMLLTLPNGGKVDATTGGALYSALQQLIINWDHFAGTPGLRPAVFDVIDQTLAETSHGQPGASKLIIWTWFVRSTEATVKYCDSLFPGQVVAAYSKANSVKSVERFMDDPKTTILVAQPGSAGMGLNPQHVCWEMLFLEAMTRSIQFRQAAGRIDREGQKYNPNIRLAMAADTLQVSMFRSLLANDAEVMRIQSGEDIRAAIRGL